MAPKTFFTKTTGPSGSAKGILLQSVILDIYRGVFEIIYIYIFGLLQISVDSNWTPVKTYIQDELKVDLEKEVYV